MDGVNRSHVGIWFWEASEGCGNLIEDPWMDFWTHFLVSFCFFCFPSFLLFMLLFLVFCLCFFSLFLVQNCTTIHNLFRILKNVSISKSVHKFWIFYANFIVCEFQKISPFQILFTILTKMFGSFITCSHFKQCSQISNNFLFSNFAHEF